MRRAACILTGHAVRDFLLGQQVHVAVDLGDELALDVVAAQDAALLKLQTQNIQRFGGEQYASTEIDVLGRHIWRLLKKAERGDASGGDEAHEDIKTQYERQSHPYYASARLWDDGVIDPVDTREVLGLSLLTALNAPLAPEAPFGVLRM